MTSEIKKIEKKYNLNDASETMLCVKEVMNYVVLNSRGTEYKQYIPFLSKLSGVVGWIIELDFKQKLREKTAHVHC